MKANDQEKYEKKEKGNISIFDTKENKVSVERKRKWSKDKESNRKKAKVHTKI